MKKSFLTPILLLLGVFNLVKAQQLPTITPQTPAGVICKDIPFSIPFNTTGTFEAGNTFKVQIKSVNSNTWVDFITQDATSPLRVVVPLNFDESAPYYSQYYLRIISSKPMVMSSEITIPRLYKKAKIELSGSPIEAINPYGMAPLNFQGKGDMPIKVVFNDSSSVNLLNYYYNSDASAMVFPAATKEYKVAYSENICGRGEGNGSVKITVNEIALKPLLNTNENVCVGGILKIPYVAGGKFNATNKFRIGLRDIYGNKNEYELEATEKDGNLETLIPEFIPAGLNYQIRILSSSPKAVSKWNTDYSILIGETPSAEVISPSISISWGNETEIHLSLKGIAPWHVTLNDGTLVTYDYYTYYSGNPLDFIVPVKPNKTQDFYVESFTSGCGTGKKGSNIMNVIVESGIVIDSLKRGLKLCLGESFNVKYSTKGSIDISKVSAFISNGIDDNTARIKVPATFNNGIIKVSLPLNLFSDDDSSYRNYDSFYFGILKENGERIYSPNYELIRIKSLPKASFYYPVSITLPNKGTAIIPVNIQGSGPITITFRDSTTYTFAADAFYNLAVRDVPIPVINDVIFKIKSVSNSCGMVPIEDDNVLPVNIRNLADRDIVIKNHPYRVCTGEKAKVYFNTLGNFDTNNEFKVELLENDNPIATIGTGKGSFIEFIVPDKVITNSNDTYSIRILSTNPTTVSQKSHIQINRKPEVTFSANFHEVLPNSKVIFSVNRNRLTSLEGTNTYVFSDGSIYYDNEEIYKFFTKSGAFSLVSASNECGKATLLNNTINIKVVPFRLMARSAYDSYLNAPCIGNSASFIYSINGEPVKGTTFNLQIASQKDSLFKDIVLKTVENPVRFKIPTNLKDDDYFLRIVSNTTPQIVSDYNRISIQTPPIVTLNTADGTGGTTIDGGNSTLLKYEAKGGIPVSVVTVDNFNQSYFFYMEKSYNFSVFPLKTTTYTIKNTENSCGFATGFGSAKITLRPALTINSISPSSIYTGKEIEVNYSTVGEYGIDNYFTFTIINSVNVNGVIKTNRYEVGKAFSPSSTVKFKIPTNAVSGFYQLEVSSSSPSSTKNISNYYFTVSNLLDISISGNTVINSGQNAYLSVVNNIQKLSMSTIGETGNYFLSDGSKGFITNIVKNIIAVKPSSTTTYTLSSVENACGKGKVSGSATVTVNPTSANSISNDFFVQFLYPFICSGATYSVPFTTKGSFTTTNKFIAQLSDKNGDNFKDISSQGDISPLKVTIPDDLPEGDNYRIRIIATDKDVSSAANNAPLSAIKAPVATLDSSTYFFVEGKPVNVKINLTGTSPWAIKFGTEELLARLYSGITSSPFTLKLNPLSPIAYKIFSVNDAYCVGKVSGTGIVRLELITANEELSDFEVKLFPNPTSDKITIQSDNFKNSTLQIFDNVGRQILQQNITKSETILDISNFKTGQYLLQIERDNKRIIYKIGKL